jgi:hypothetical protein
MASRTGLGNLPTVERHAESLFVYNEPWFLSRIRRTRRGATVLNRITQAARVAHVHPA